MSMTGMRAKCALVQSFEKYASDAGVERDGR